MATMMREILNGIEAFVRSVEAGSFAAAAEQLHLTRSAIAKTIARIETRLDLRLFQRSTRKLRLTADGQTYYQHCVRALEELRAAHAALESGRRQAVGRLRVSLPVLFGQRCIAPILTRVAAEHPQLELELGFSDRPVDLIEDGFDLAIRVGAIDTGAGLTLQALGRLRMVVCAAPAYLQRHGHVHSLDQINQHQTICYGRYGRTARWQFPDREHGVRELTPPCRLRLDDLAAIADAATAGYGLAWLPYWLIREQIGNGTLLSLLDDLPQQTLPVHALWPQTPYLPLRVRVAIDALTRALPAGGEC